MTAPARRPAPEIIELAKALARADEARDFALWRERTINVRRTGNNPSARRAS